VYKVTLINDGVETIIHHHFFNELKLELGQIKEQINVASGFTFSILPNNPGYNQIYPLKTLIKIENMQENKVVFEGRILRPTESMSSSGIFGKAFICESELGYLNDSSQRHGEYHDITVRDFLQVIIDNHNADVADDPIDKTFKVGIVDVDSSTGTLYRYLGYGKTFDEIEDKLIDRLGGELRVRKENGVRYLDYLWSIGERKSTEIRLAKNLNSISKEVDPSSVITRLIPLGERIESDDEDATDASQARLTIESINDGKDYIIDHAMEELLGTVIVKSKSWDDITQPSILKTRGEQHLQENNRIKEQHQISALDLSIIGKDPDAFEVGNWHPVINPVMDIDDNLRIVGKTTDIINPENNDLTIGDQFKKASDYQREANKSQRKVVELENTVERQSKRLSTIQQELDNVDDILDQINEAIGDADIPALETAIGNLNEAVSDLTDAVDAIPDYDPATETTDGLMSADDKAKLNLITLLENINLDEVREKLKLITLTDDIDLDELKEKLDLITVTEDVDLDDLKQRVEALENEEN